MKDFRFNDSLDEEESSGYNEDPGEKKKIVKFLIIALVAAISGFSVYFITDALINGNRKPVAPVVQDVEMELNDEMIIYLYDNVTYSVSGIRNDKFFKSNKVTVDDFTTQDKFYYALRYAVLDDFVDMTVTDDETYDDTDVPSGPTADGENNTNEEQKKEEPKFRTFSISNEKIKEYMYNFFGENVTYTTDSPINIAVNFTVNGFNAGTLKYDSASDSFLIQFDSVSESAANMAINPYLYKKVSAVRKGENSNIVIEESVVFTSVSQDKDGAGNLIDQYDFAVYSDYAKTKMIEQKSDVKKSDITAIGIENYKDNATTIRYTFFKDENNEYHFLSSEIVS